MVSAQMWWGSSDVPSGIPYNLSVNYTNTGRGLRITGGVRGPGCGNFFCGDRWVNLTFYARFYLGTQRMPESGCIFTSRPWVNFEGHLRGQTTGGGLFDDSSAKCGVRLRQYVYSGGTLLGVTANSMQRLINIDGDSHETEWHVMWGNIYIPEFRWTLNRTRQLQIDIEVRFRMYLEGTGEISYWGAPVIPTPPFVFDLPQWSIESVDV